MKLIEINRENLNDFLAGQEHSVFLQSYDWGEFQNDAGFEVFRFGVEDEGELLAVISLIKKKLFANFNYFYAQKGPVVGRKVIKSKVESVYRFLFSEIRKMAKREKCIFLRFEPDFPISQFPNFPIFKSIDLQPAKTLILDLSKDEKDLLADMHQKTRYNIRLAEKKGVEITEALENDFEEFWKLMEETNKRDGFRLHSKEYYYKMLNFNKNTSRNKPTHRQADTDINKLEIKNLKLKLFLAKYKEKIVSANIISFFGDTVTYMHGASSNENRNVMAPYLLQWEIIKKAKNLGYEYYDFFGIDEKKWPGVTRYKKGFCEKNQEKHLMDYPGTYDLAFGEAWYGVYKVLRKLRRKF